MSRPQWTTLAGSLGTIPEGVFYSVLVQAEAPGDTVLYRLIAGELPDGIQLRSNGTVEGTPRPVARVQGVPREVSQDVTSQFAIRAYTVLGNGQVNRFCDRTFEITVTGQDIPDFVTPAGLVGTFYDGTRATVQIEITDPDPDDTVLFNLVSGSLPPGLTLDRRTGLISGVITPLSGPAGTEPTGYDATQFDQFPYDFSTRGVNTNFQFTLEITDGKDRNLRTFEIFVYSYSTMIASTTDITGDTTFVTADASPNRLPVLLTPPGDLGRVRADNFYAFKFDAVDFDGDALEYVITVGPGIGYDVIPYDQDVFDRGSFSLPPGLVINPDTGWFYGYIPNQGATEFTYRFAVQVRKANDPELISAFAYFTITIVGNIDTAVEWLTPQNLGRMANGSISTLSVVARALNGQSLLYRLQPGAVNRLPQGLTLQPTGNITGRTSFNTFSLDRGTTTFDIDLNPRLGIDATTFDSRYDFTVNAYSPQDEQFTYRVGSIIVASGGSGYDPLNPPTVTISAPPATENATQATAGAITISGGAIVAIALGNPGLGYTSAPTVTISGGGGVGASATTTIVEAAVSDIISVTRRFTLVIDRVFNEPYEKLYIKAMPPLEDRARLATLLDPDAPNALIPRSSLYRADDPNFGIATGVVYDHAYGLQATALETYVNAMDINHYWRDITLGPIRTARALDSSGAVLYEVVYSEIIDNLVNDRDVSVGKSVTLPYTIDVDGSPVTVVYPNSLDNMRDQIIDTVGQVSPALPLWMTSKQANNQVLGFTPAWVMAYVRPGEAGAVLYRLQQGLKFDLNSIDYKVDRYELDRSQTYNWDPATDQWRPFPAESATFDRNTVRLYETPDLETFGRVDSVSTQLAFGTDTEFTAAPTTPSPLVIVQVNGILQTYANTGPSGITGDFWINYAFNSFTVQFVTPPPSTTQTFTGDGTTTDFVFSPVAARGLVVRVDGVTQTLDTDYTVLLDTVTLTTPPLPGESVEIIQPSVVSIYQIADIYVNDPTSPYQTATTWDLGTTTFNSPADRWRATDEFDKYLVFPKRTIIG